MRALVLAPFLAALALAGCSRENAGVAAVGTPAQPGSTTAASAAPLPERAPRSTADRVVELRRALDFGDFDAARAASGACDEAGPEGELLRARMAALEGRGVEAMRILEAQKAARPRDPDVYATASECYANRDAFDTAWSEIQAGSAACGETAEILRAKGICWIAREGGAERGLAALLKARELDPALPFCDRALGQAHLLVAKMRAKEEKLPAALAAVRTSLEHDPDDVDARRFLVDVLAASGQHIEAVAELTALVERGEPLQSELALMHKRAGFARLLEQDRAGAVEHFLEARALGLKDSELASAAEILIQVASEEIDRGVAAYAAGEADRAEASFRRALDVDPGSLPAKNHLAVVRFQRGDPAEAARLWRGVIDEARATGVELPEPVHLNLAKADVLNGDRAAAKSVLEAYLRDDPRGEWTGMTRALLAQIESEPR